MKSSGLLTRISSVMKDKLFLIVLLAFIIRLLFFFFLEPWESSVIREIVLVSDAGVYHDLALSLLSTKSFAGFTGLRTPGYPLFLAIVYATFSSSVWVVLIIQILLNLVSLVLVYKIASTVFSPRIGALSSFLFAIDMNQALYTVALYSDSIFVFQFLLSIYLLIKGLRQGNEVYLIGSALVLGLSALTRPVVILFPVVVLFISFYGVKQTQLIKRLFSVSFFLIMFILVVSTWSYRNYVAHGNASLTSQYGTNLLFCNAAYTESYRTGAPMDSVIEDFAQEAKEMGVDTFNDNLFKQSDIYYQIAKKYIRENWAVYTKRHIMGIINMYSALSTSHIASVFHLKSKSLSVGQENGPSIFKRIGDFFRSKTKAEIVIGISIGFFLIINYFFALLGLAYSNRKQRTFVLLFSLIIIYFSLLTGVIGITRLRLPFMPFINILCSVGLVAVIERFGPKVSTRLRN